MASSSYMNSSSSGLKTSRLARADIRSSTRKLIPLASFTILMANPYLSLTGADRSFGAGLQQCGVNGSKTFSFGGLNGGSRMVAGCSRFGGTFGASAGSGDFPSSANYDAKGTYLTFNVGDSLFISNINSQNKDPIKYIHFSISIPICHAFDYEAKDGHDLLVGLHSGDRRDCRILVSSLWELNIMINMVQSTTVDKRNAMKWLNIVFRKYFLPCYKGMYDDATHSDSYVLF